MERPHEWNWIQDSLLDFYKLDHKFKIEYETFIENLNEYKKLRMNHELSTLNADLIIEYMKTRISVA